MAIQRELWAKLEPGILFDNGRDRGVFLVIEKSADVVRVIPLSAENVKHILHGEQCEAVSFGFNDIWVGNIVPTVNETPVLPLFSLLEEFTLPPRPTKEF